jgi:hypothetical protein
MAVSFHGADCAGFAANEWAFIFRSMMVIGPSNKHDFVLYK